VAVAGKTLRRSFDAHHDRNAAHVLSAFAALGLIVWQLTLYAMSCQKHLNLPATRGPYRAGQMGGLERERSKDVGSARRPAGIRKFTRAALVRAAADHLGRVPILRAVTTGVMALATLSYVGSRNGDPGLTTKIGLIAAFEAALRPLTAILVLPFEPILLTIV
jgi:hypothetical protein